MKKAELSLETAKEMYKSGGVAKQFALDNYTEQELTTREVKCWEDLGVINGYFIDYDGSTLSLTDGYICDTNKIVFAYKDQAEASIAMAMLSQLMKDVNGDWKPDWMDANKNKWVIYFKHGNPVISTLRGASAFLAFPTREIVHKFLENHRELIEKAKPLL